MDTQFEIGKTYPLRNGGTGQPLRIEDRGPYPMQVLLRTPDGDYFLEWASREGRVYYGARHGNDLLLPIGEEAAMNNLLAWQQSQSGNWWLAQSFPGSTGWRGLCLVFRRGQQESAWLASVPDQDGPRRRIRDIPFTSLQEAARAAEDWAEGRGYRIAERFPVQPPSAQLAETNRRLTAMPPARITAEDARRQVAEHRAEADSEIQNHPKS